MADYIRYANQSATRRLPLHPSLLEALSFLPELGVTAEVFSGGQPARGSRGSRGRRVGSTRHDLGLAADVFFEKDGRRLDWSNPNDVPLFQEIVKKGKEAGLTGFGAGPGYMQQGSMHLGFGPPSVWGTGGSSSKAPDWLRSAYNEAGAPAPSRGLGMAALLDGPPPTPAQGPAPVQASRFMLSQAPVEQPPQAAGTPAPPLGPPRTIADRPIAPMQPSPMEPPPGLLAQIGQKASDAANSPLMSMLAALQPSEAPQLSPPPPMPQQPTALADLIASFMQTRKV